MMVLRYALCRLIHSDWPLVERNDWPLVEVQQPYMLFLGWRQEHAQKTGSVTLQQPHDPQPKPPAAFLESSLDFNSISDLELPLQGGMKYCFRSANEEMFCVVSPPDTPPLEQLTSNLRISWTSNADLHPVGRVIFVQEVVEELPPSLDNHSPNAKRKTRAHSTVFDVPRGKGEHGGGQQCILVRLPMVHEGVLTRVPNHKGPWKTIECHTQLDSKREQGITQRIEHHLPTRVPSTQFWSRLSRGGYGARNDRLLRTQSQAAICWQFAARRVIEDAGWGRTLFEQSHSFVYLMGFETNNPFHDDFRYGDKAFGPHWHLALRGGVTDVTPHIYISDSDGSSLRLMGDESAGSSGNYWSFGSTFGIRVTNDGRLELGPLTRLQHVPSRKYLHVLLSTIHERTPNAVLFGPPNDFGSVWMVSYDDGSKSLQEEILVTLRNVRSGQYLHVRQGAQGVGHPVSVFRASEGEGSQWKLKRSSEGIIRLQNTRALGTYLSAAANAEERCVTTQSADIDYKHGCDAWVLDATHTVDRSYSIRVLASPDGAEAIIERNGLPWQRVQTRDDAVNGRLDHCVLSSSGALILNESINYDPATGNKIGG